MNKRFYFTGYGNYKHSKGDYDSLKFRFTNKEEKTNETSGCYFTNKKECLDNKIEGYFVASCKDEAEYDASDCEKSITIY